jgi:2-polyprenyl-3-methyl-5-hydroxy-6-metoxy-1,4-benzoquinol methylase
MSFLKKNIDSVNLHNKISRVEIKKVLSKITEGEYQFESSKCPICKNDKGIQLAEKDRYGLPYDLILCKCGLAYQKKRLDKNSLFDFYKNHYYKIYAQNSIIEYEKEEFKQGKIVYDFLTEFVDNKNIKILEVGSGASGILKYFKNKGFENLTGLELDPKYVEYSNKNGRRTIQGDISTIQYEKFDLIIYNHVFEHINDLSEELRLVRNKLDKSGLLYIEVPSLVKLRDYNYNVNGFYQNAHTYNFTINTLKNLMSISSFETLKIDDFVRGAFKITVNKENTINYCQKEVLSNLTLNRIKYYFFFLPRILFYTPINIIKKGLKILGLFDNVKHYYLKLKSNFI